MSAVGLLGRSERLLMQRYGILTCLRRQFSMPDAAFEDAAAYLNLIHDLDALDQLDVALNQVTGSADALTLVAETAHRQMEKREIPSSSLGDRLPFDPRGRRNLYQSIVEEVGQMTATQRSLGALGRRLRQTELLINEGCSVLSHLDRNVLMQQVVSVVRQLLAGDVSLAILLNKKGEPDAFWEDGVDTPLQRLPQEMAFLLQPVHTGEILLIENLRQIPQASVMPPHHINIQRVVSAPLMVRGEIVGVLVIGKTTYAPIFDAEDLKLLQTFVKQASVALENAYLHDAIRELDQLQERQRIAQDLHDSVVQMLFVMGMEVESLLVELPPESAMHRRAQRIRRLISRATADLRGAIGALTQGESRDDEPLSVLLQELVEEFEKISHLEATLVTPSQWPNLNDKAAQAIYRIVREALANIQKHAHASTAIVSITSYLDRLVITIQDDGVGFAPDISGYQTSNLHFGMSTMHQLAQQAGGFLETLNNEDGGALVRFTLPMNRQNV